MQLVKFKDGRYRIIDVVSKIEPADALNYQRQVKVYSFDKLQAFNFEVVSKDAIERCLEETIEIMSPTLPYTVVENIEVSIVPHEKYLINIIHKDSSDK